MFHINIFEKRGQLHAGGRDTLQGGYAGTRLNWIRLGLDDVLYDPKSKTIYTPNTNAYVKMGEAVKQVDDEQRSADKGDKKTNYIQLEDGSLSGKAGEARVRQPQTIMT